MDQTREARIAEAEAARAAIARQQAEFLDWVLDKAEVKNDRRLAHLLEMTPPVISKLRNGHMAVSAPILVAISEVTGIPVADMKGKLGYKILKRKCRA